MNKEQIIDLLNIGENREIEFKEAKSKLPKSLWETYSAFANTNGGIIILGIKEDKTNKIYSVEGIDDIDNIIKDFWNTINNKEKISINILNDDYVKITKFKDKKVLIINIPNANRKEKPIYINNNPITGTYKRYHDGDFKCNEKEVKVMFSESSDETKDGIVLEEFNINNIDKETLESYRKKFRLHKGQTHEWNDLLDKEFLYMIRAIDRKTDKLTLAGLLMFGKERDIVEVKPNYFLDYREIKDIETTERWSHRITSADGNWSGNLWDFFNKIVNRLTADIEIPFELDKSMMRIEDTEVHKSVREGLSNSLIHADFSESGSIVIEKGQNYFKFSNPGNLRIPVDIVMLGGRSDPRNAILHQMFSYLGYGERAGSGLYMISTVWKNKNWIKPEIKEELNPNRTILILNMKEDSTNYPKNYTNNYTNKLNKTQVKIISVIRENPIVTVKELSEMIDNITLAGIKWNLKKMKENGIIDREGTTRKGRWIIL